MNVPTEASHSGWTVKQAMQTSGAVDLGLSVKWAACNLGANSPEECGDYYAWGEIETKADYSDVNYEHKNGSYSYTDIGENIAGTRYDVARAVLGGSWRLPQVEQIQELIDACTFEKHEYKGVNGQKVTGPNGNSIFLPITGYYAGRSINNRDKNGDVRFWASQMYTSYNHYAYAYLGYGNYTSTQTRDRKDGLVIRPICDK
jgi:uncharacterized protein (TIGR02145 family)